jgi:hypothetical protein
MSTYRHVRPDMQAEAALPFAELLAPPDSSTDIHPVDGPVADG